MITDAKQRLLELLKRADGATAAQLAAALGLTEAAVRQHLDGLGERGLVVGRGRGRGREGRGRGRPALTWSLTPLARELFPDRHADLTVELLTAVRETVGDDGLTRVLAARRRAQTEAYRAVVPAEGRASLGRRVETLARQRSAEGYMAEARREGDTVVLVEHHCPIACAATTCAGLCGAELELFREVLGRGVTVERTSHLLAGDQRCTYRITPAPVGRRRRAG